MFRKIKADFGQCFISGNLLYSMKKVEEVKAYNCFLYLSGKTEYVMEINKYEQEKLIREQDIHKDPLAKQCIELIIRDILQANPKLEFYKNVFVNTKKKQKHRAQHICIFLYFKSHKRNYIFKNYKTNKTKKQLYKYSIHINTTPFFLLHSLK